MQHTLKASPDTVHWGFFDRALEPVLKVKSGDTVDVFTVAGSPETVERLSIRDRVPPELLEIHRVKERGEGAHVLTGPIEIEGAEVGDVLEVAFLDVRPWANFGINAIFPGGGTIPEDFAAFTGRVIPVDLEKMTAAFSKDLSLPLQPFFGCVGVSPSSGRITSNTPGIHGGNLDNKELVASSKLYLPVQTSGALFSLGDGHGCQGDGEVDVTALEIAMRGLVSLRVLRGKRIEYPIGATREFLMPMAFHSSLDEALRTCLRNTIRILVENKGLTREEAYMVCSLGIDFRITQSVNTVKGVHAMIPRRLLKEGTFFPST